MLQSDKSAEKRAYYLKNRERFLAKRKQYYAENKERVLKEQAAYRQRNKEAIQEYFTRHYAEHREKVKTRMAEYYAGKGGEKRRAATIAYRKNNPDKIQVFQRNRDTREQNALGALTAKEWAAIKARQKGRCFDCGVKASLTIGHLVPVSKGGSNLALNICGQCKPCNSKQHAKVHPAAKPSLFDVTQGAVHVQ